MQREGEDHQDAQPEGRHGLADLAEAERGIVRHAVAPSRRLHAEGQPDDHGDEEGQPGQGQRHGEALHDEVEHRALVAERDAELAAGHRADPREVLRE